MRFALEEVKIGLAILLSEFKFDISDKYSEFKPLPGSVFFNNFSGVTLKLSEKLKDV